MTINSTHLENDEFDYSCYVVVIPAPARLTEPLLEIEQAAGQRRAKIPAHVTVKGTFYGIKSLDGIIEKIGEVAARHRPFTLGFEGRGLVDSVHSVILDFPVNPDIQALHDDLMVEIGPLGKSAYPDDPYWVHMSIVNEVSPEGVETASNLLAGIDFGNEMQVEVIDLFARDGTAWEGTWKRLERFSLTGG
jgi:2'-5' RNA ligase